MNKKITMDLQDLFVCFQGYIYSILINHTCIFGHMKCNIHKKAWEQIIQQSSCMIPYIIEAKSLINKKKLNQ